MKSICVFCGSGFGNDPIFREVAENLGKKIAEKKITLVYGGGNVGLMGSIAKSCMDNGGHVTGVITEKLFNLGVAYNEISELKVVKTMHERKNYMAEISNAFISLPGGIGTLEETFEIFTWQQLGIIQKPLALLNIKGYYNSLIDFLNNSVKKDFLRKEHLDSLIIEDEVVLVLKRILNYTHKTFAKWENLEQKKLL